MKRTKILYWIFTGLMAAFMLMASIPDVLQIPEAVAILRAFPDGHSEIEQTFEDGEWVIVEWTFGGTMRGEFAGHAPTGRRFMLRGCELFHVTEGKIRLQRGYWDRATWFSQLELPINL